MRATLSSSRLAPRDDLLRWGLAFALALLAHGTLAAALLVRSPPPPDGLPSDALTIDLEPAPTDQRPDDVAGPETTDSVDPPPEPETASEPEPPAPDSPPPELAEAKPPTEAAPPELTAPPVPASQTEAVLPPTPEERPPEPKPREEVAETKPEVKPQEQTPQARQERLTAPSQARAASAALLGGGGRPSAAAIATWGAKLGAHLAQHKRYPAQARARQQQGTATLRITLDGSGRVLSRTLVKGSGNALLDQESLGLILRAEPLPKPPPNMALPVTVTVPVRFSIR